MAVNARWRRNPFTGDVNSILITEESHTIEYFTEQNAYGFFADEGIVLDTGDPVVLVQDNTAQTAFTEIPKTIAPNAGQFRVDYDETGHYNTGFVNCNSGDVGKVVLFTYRGTGTIVHPTFRLQTDFNLPGNLSVEGTTDLTGETTIHGSVILADATGSTISASNKTINDVSNPVVATDAVNRQTAISLLSANTGYELLTTSGTWVCPENVTQVIYGAIGGGGGGGGNPASGTGAAGGGGGGAIWGVSAVTPGASYAYTIGAGGSGGAIGAAGTAGGDTIIFSRTATGGGGGGFGGAAAGAAGDGDASGGAGGASSGNPGAGGGAAGGLAGAGTTGASNCASPTAGGKSGGVLGGRGGTSGDTTTPTSGGAGGSYGAGGGGGGSNGVSGAAGGAGAQGVIVLIFN